MNDLADQIQMKTIGDVAYISINLRRLDTDSSQVIKNALHGKLDYNIKHAMVELGQVEIIDSSGIGILLSLHRRLAKEGSKLTLLNVQPPIRVLLELLRLQQIINIV